MSTKNIATGYRLMLGYLGIFTILIGIILMVPLLVIPFYPEEIKYALNFFLPGAGAICLGYALTFFIKNRVNANLENMQDSILLLFVWIVAIAMTALPFLMTGEYNFTQSIFEATSALTTTGLSVVAVDQAPHIYLFFRSFMQFVGGIGIVLVLMSIISDRYSLRIYNAEGHNDRLIPNLKGSARLIVLIYSAYVILGVIAYVIAGMGWFDAINHSMAAISTGGFATHSDSIGYFDNPSIDYITIVLMLLGSTNILMHLFLIQGRVKQIWKHMETKFIVFFLLIVVPIG
jgi:trk system potassium uptake protein TrkH